MTIFSGAWPALITPFTPDDQVNVPVLRDLIDYLIAKDVNGFYIGGSTGEGVYMSLAERKLLIETALAHIDGRVPAIVHVGGMVARDAVALARYAAEHGAVGLSSILPPQYRTMDSLCAYFAGIANAVPDLPFFGYVFGGTVDALTLMRRLLDLNLPNFAGTKYTGPDIFEIRRIINLRDDNWYIFSGMDEMCLYAAMNGTCANIGSTLNLMPGAYRAIWAALAAGDIASAQAWQTRANVVTAVLIEHGFQASLKASLSLIGFDVGAPRLPNLPHSPEAVAALLADLRAAGVEELAAL